ncbi:hypothetical protein CYMTET_50537 [Cymbomonas tetramitiformis]|uniref:PiggyBac transposable element-derived protein domain-containing protein n=1 Tax=Cymbomonas tetramitiformis TaxID=36881 RepID=A0AAE0BMU3_9CHLO|nr:hypothetical protein CYMTET_50537 [Cymbomonas tetramitiformis]
MNSVDLADQHRNQYRMDGPWMRQKKWWWAIFLWALEAAWGNAYLCYRQMCVQAKKDKYLSHRKFLEAGAKRFCGFSPAPLNCEPDRRQSVSSNESVSGKRAVKLTSKMMDNMITRFVGKHPMKSLVNVTHCQWCKFKVKVAGEKRKRDLSADSVDDEKKNPRAQFGCEACNVWFCGPECWNEFHGLT